MQPRHIFLFTLLLAHPLMLHAQSSEGGQDVSLPRDTIIHLRHAEVTARRTTSTFKTAPDGALLWNTRHLDLLPRILGNADPIHYTQMLPGVQTNSEYRGGINVQGCDNAHSALTIGGVPVYNANHLLGIFSTFNAYHYPALSLRKTATDALHPARLGAHLDMQIPLPDEEEKEGGKTSAEIIPTDAESEKTEERRPSSLGEEWGGLHLEAGLISSQASLQLRPTRQTLISLSGRLSYINLFYGPFLKIDGSDVNYSFGDLNATIAHRHGRHTVALDTYYGSDRAHITTDKASSDFASRWGNNMQALHWTADFDRGTLHTTAYHTAYRNNFNLKMLNIEASLPASIDEAALTSRFKTTHFAAALEAIYRHALPQQPLIESYNGTTTQHVLPQHGTEFALPLHYTLGLLPDRQLTLTAGLRPTLYVAPHYANAALDPSLRIDFARGPFTAAVSASGRHQNVFQTGFSDMGLPSEFWILADENHHAQSAYGVAAEAGYWLPGRTWHITADAYYKRLYNQLEYDGTVFSILTTNYHLDDILRPGSGYNWGASVMLARPTGTVNGWIAYSFTRARRHFTGPAGGSAQAPAAAGSPQHGASGTGINGTDFPATHERPHELNAVVTYDISPHWSASTTVVAASGTPFTAPTSFYLLSGNLISQFGDHNAYRLPPYFRIDLAGSYKWKRRRTSHAINLSIYNCTARKNALFYTIHISRSNQEYTYAPTAFFTRVLPSISYALTL